MTQSVKRFLFEHDFGDRQGRTGAATGASEVRLSPEALAAMEARFEEGRALGLAEAHASIEAQSTASLSAIAATMRAVSHTMDRELARIESDSIQMAVTLARLYADVLIDRDPAPLIAEAIRKCSEMTDNPATLIITIGASSPASVRKAISTAASEVGLLGPISVREDAELAPGDIRITWPEGGYLRERRTIDAIIRSMIDIEAPSSTPQNGSIT